MMKKNKIIASLSLVLTLGIAQTVFASSMKEEPVRADKKERVDAPRKRQHHSHNHQFGKRFNNLNLRIHYLLRDGAISEDGAKSYQEQVKNVQNKRAEYFNKFGKYDPETDKILSQMLDKIENELKDLRANIKKEVKEPVAE